ncbi:MAG: hypothetical protein ACLSBH_08635 [Coprobacillus cateniformis]
MEIEYVLIFIGVILALLLLYFGFTRLIKNKELNNKVMSTIDINALLTALGGRDNLTDVKSSPSKLTVALKNHDLVKVEDIQKLGASGIVEGKENLSMIFWKTIITYCRGFKEIFISRFESAFSF